MNRLLRVLIALVLCSPPTRPYDWRRFSGRFKLNLAPGVADAGPRPATYQSQ